MGGLRTHLLGALALAGTGAQAEIGGDLMKTFASCAGRYSAEVEHSWLVSGTDPDVLEDRREATLSLLAAVTDETQSIEALDLRIRAKHDHARLLLIASFHTDRDIATRARSLATTRIRACSSMLLG